MLQRECIDKDLTRKPNILTKNVILVLYHTSFQGFATHTFKMNVCTRKELEHLTFANLKVVVENHWISPFFPV